MMQHNTVDPYTYHVLQSIDEKVRSSMTPAQLSAVSKAIAANRPYKKHAIDIRGVLPLFFARYYFVFMMGRDRRYSTRRMEESRHRGTSILSGLMLFVLGVGSLIIIAVLVLYLIKSGLGINIMPDVHLKDLLMFWKQP